MGEMIIGEAFGTYNMKDAKMYLTNVVLVIENKTAAPQYQFRIAILLKDIEKAIKKNGALLITKSNGETIKFAFYKKSKMELFYNYLLNSENKSYDYTKCVFCDAPLQGKFCTLCGHKQPGILQNTCEEVLQNYRCWSCGAEFENKVDFCSECGAKQDVNKLLVRIGTEMSKKYLTNICPRCSSRNIKYYRKGYDYKVGFWGAIFGVRGSGYAGGFNANHTCCRCMNCGNDWETDYDYRLINK